MGLGGLVSFAKDQLGRPQTRPSEMSRIGNFQAGGPSALTEDPLDSFQRFDLTGHGLKGQLTSGYGQAGYGIELAVGVDFGTFICPWLVRLPLDIKVGGARTHHTEMVLTRFPTAVFDRRLSKTHDFSGATPRPRFVTTRPLVVATLRGIRWEGAASVSVGAAVGVGDPLGSDELMFGLGAQVKMSMSGTLSTTYVVDLYPLAFASAYPPPVDPAADGADNLAGYINSELEGDVKRRVLAWIAQRGGDDVTSGTIKAGRFVNNTVSELTTHWAATQHHQPSFDADPTGAFQKFFGRLSRLKRQSTQDIIDALDEYHDRLITLPVQPLTSHQSAVRDSDLIRIQQIRATLRGRHTRKTQGLPAFTVPVSPAPERISSLDPIAQLRIASRTFDADAGAGVVAKVLAGGQATFTARSVGKYMSSRFQSVSQRSSKTLVFTQDSILRQQLYFLDAVATARLPTGKPKQATRELLYGTVTYMSACAYWEPSVRPIAFPNGSGVSFGLSIDAARLRPYVVACKVPADEGPFPASAVALEQMLVAQLRVDPLTLRSFLKKTPDDLIANIASGAGSSDTSVLLESSFALKETTLLGEERGGRHEPSELLASTWAVARRDGDATASDTTSLDVMRVRYRKRRAIDKSRSLLSFGWAFTTDHDFDAKGQLVTPGATFGSPVSAGGALSRVERVGSEGIIDLHTEFFSRSPIPIDRLFEAHELSVPGVSLFSQ